MLYPFVCDNTGCYLYDQPATLVRRKMQDAGDPPPPCPMCDQPMRRQYGDGQKRDIIRLGMADYIEKAYRGEELPAGMTQRQVKAIVDSQVKSARKGRRTTGGRRRGIVS